MRFEYLISIIFHTIKVGARLEELEVMKMAHLSKFVEKSRQELRGLWDQCYFGQEQRNAFREMCSTDYNEEMLDEHENEVERLKGFLKENSEIFEKVYNESHYDCPFPIAKFGRNLATIANFNV